MTVREVQKNAPNGLGFATFEIPQPVPLTWALDECKKLRFVCHHSVEYHENSYKYEPECLVVFWSSQYPTLEWRRATNGRFFRVESMIPVEDRAGQLRAEVEYLRREHPGVFGRVFGDFVK